MMKRLNRRQFLKAGSLLAGSLTLAGCNSQVQQFLAPAAAFETWPDPTSNPNWRLLNRLTFGPRPAERRRLADIGPQAFIEEQLAPDSLTEDPGFLLRLRRLESLHLDVTALFDMPEQTTMRQLQQAALLRAVYSHRQLHEIMVNFWSDHFSIAQLKDDCAWLKTIDDRDVIRPHALGNFQDLLFASAHSPAMLIYLDNQENVTGSPNENYARELMELHTLGVEGGYSQKDVQELARCLTGWTVKEHFYRGQFTFNAEIHDTGPKHVFGLNIPAGTMQAGGEAVLEMLANHPATARFIATKLTRRFIADDPPPALVARAADTFLKTGGDIKAVLRAILLSPEMLDAPAPPRKLKRPFNFVAGALRQLNADTDGSQPLLTYLSQMGQPLFQWLTPDGFPDFALAWQGSLLTRWRFAMALAHGQIPGTTVDLDKLVALAEGSTDREAAEQRQHPAENLKHRVNRLAVLLLGRPLPGDVVDRLLSTGVEANDQVLLAALLGSPSFQWK